VELVLRQMIDYGGPLLYHGGEDQQRDPSIPRAASSTSSLRGQLPPRRLKFLYETADTI
jgi:hypothetical protein